MKDARLRPALPFTVLSEPGTVRLVAGEDHRYTLNAPGLEMWLPGLLQRLDGRRTLQEALGPLDPVQRDAAAELVDRLLGERILVEGPTELAHPVRPSRAAFEGCGPLKDGDSPGDAGAPAVRVLCQDRLDYDEALRFNRSCLSQSSPWMWATTGPLSRGYVSPAFLPGSGPCLGCLIRHFRRLSPAPEIYDGLIAHAQEQKPIVPVSFPAEGLDLMRAILRWKIAALGDPAPPAALYRLHVVETASMEVSTHRVFPDPACPDCSRRP